LSRYFRRRLLEMLRKTVRDDTAFRSRVAHAEARSRSALEPLSIARFERMIATAPHAADENHRFNAHSSSAVPFNWLFPHS